MNKNFFLILILDLSLFIVSFLGSYLVRFDFNIPELYWRMFIATLPYVVLIKLLLFFFFDLYSGMWRYTGFVDLLNVIKASSLSTLLIVIYVLIRTRFVDFSRSVFFIDWCFTVLFISGSRLGIRLYFELLGQDKSLPNLFEMFRMLFCRPPATNKRLIIIGAGDCGEKIYRDIGNNDSMQYRVVGFLDDDHLKIGKKIHGIPVLGMIKNIKSVAEKVRADEAIIAVPSASSQQMRQIVSHCKKSEIKFMIMPGMKELIDGKLRISAIRRVAYRDLLGREDIRLDQEEIGDYLAEHSVLLTGAGGSIGSELCRQVCRFRPERVILYERAESPLYDIEIELKQNFPDVKVVPVLGDIQDLDELEKAFIDNTPNVVFHAAAYKHVPMLELQPWKAITNNVQGTLNLIKVSRMFEIDRFVFVSTDKAVRPTNVMGASKRLAEMLVQNQNVRDTGGNTKFITVRFGNVAGSAGSVVPLFKKQIERRGPVTVTHPEVTRYFMTIPEACQLILQTGVLCSSEDSGDIYLLEMGRPIKIEDMARDLIRLSGFEPDIDIKIKYIGLRPGEKLYEELITKGEGIVPTSHEKIMTLKRARQNLRKLNGGFDELMSLASKQDGDGIKVKLKEIIPEYSPQFFNPAIKGSIDLRA